MGAGGGYIWYFGLKEGNKARRFGRRTGRMMCVKNKMDDCYFFVSNFLYPALFISSILVLFFVKKNI